MILNFLASLFLGQKLYPYKGKDGHGSLLRFGGGIEKLRQAKIRYLCRLELRHETQNGEMNSQLGYVHPLGPQHIPVDCELRKISLRLGRRIDAGKALVVDDRNTISMADQAIDPPMDFLARG